MAVISRRSFLAGTAAVLVPVLAPRKPKPTPAPGTGFGYAPFGTSAFGG